MFESLREDINGKKRFLSGIARMMGGWGLLGRDDFRFIWNFVTAFQILPCVIETRRYGYIRDSGGRVETPHGATIGCEKSYNG